MCAYGCLRVSVFLNGTVKQPLGSCTFGLPACRIQYIEKWPLLEFYEDIHELESTVDLYGIWGNVWRQNGLGGHIQNPPGHLYWAKLEPRMLTT